MLTLKQSPIAIIGILFACGLAEGEPSSLRLTIALCAVFLTVLYVLVCNRLNHKRHERETEMFR
ncbi:MAG: hypothetical protein RSH25_15680 [Bacteroides sp.]|uniref:hypothetical protein n=1 Tax=Bacteroides sp. TaxID=29523 RepID=UPI002FCC8F7E